MIFFNGDDDLKIGIKNEIIKRNIIEEMKVKNKINLNKEIRLRIDFMKNYLLKYNIKVLVLGISGGQYSTLLGKLAQLAINELINDTNGKEYQFIGIRLPYGNQLDESDCKDAIKFIEPSKVLKINIKNSVDQSVNQLKEAGIYISDFLKGNEKARERMKVQYSVAGHFNGIVLGTDHSAESVTGFFTKYGDGGSDLIPLFGLNKRQGKEMLKQLGCPEHLYSKNPTADLEDDKPQLLDEDALGVTYNDIDDFLEGKEVDKEKEKVIISHYIKTLHKRKLPVTIFD